MTTKPCCYCHNRPRREGSAYCCKKHEDAKHAQNNSDPEKRRRQLNRWRAKQREIMKARHEEELQYQREMLEIARKVLYEPDDMPHRLRPLREVDTWNVITGKIETVKL